MTYTSPGRPGFATEVLRRIAELYAIEAAIRGRPPDERKRIRQLQERPLLDKLHILLFDIFATLPLKSDIALAIPCSLNLWPALTRYRDDGRTEIDNSAAERALRGVAIGRRNYPLRAQIRAANALRQSYTRIFRPSHLLGMAEAMEADVPSAPIDVGAFRLNTVMFLPDTAS